MPPPNAAAYFVAILGVIVRAKFLKSAKILSISQLSNLLKIIANTRSVYRLQLTRSLAAQDIDI